MIPNDWIPHRRESDDELVGYLVPTGDLVRPVTVFGYRLGPAGDEVDAAALLDAEGMSCLADCWWLTPEEGGAPTKVKIYEAAPDHLTVVVDDFGAGGDLGTRQVLDVPVTDRLRRG